MTRTLGLTFAGAVAAAVLAFSVANAAPATGALDGLKSVGAAQSTVEQAHYRRCRWHHGHRHCRRHWRWWW